MRHLGIAARLTASAILVVAAFTACGNHTTGVVPPSGPTTPDDKSRGKHIVVTICDVDPAYCACQADPACSESPSPTPSPSVSTPPICTSAGARRSTNGNARSKSDCTVSVPTPTPSPTPLIEIDDAVSGAKLSGATTQIVIGKHAQLRVKVVQPPGGTLSEIQWKVPGQTVKSYAAPTSSAIQVLSNTDTTAPQIAFYWIAGAAQPV
ncbi:MAG: hypothetical protein QOJ39_1672, partial [Candidatus Eremiobacteraeota bacterium]|nr:hypothetical protein [Candidatus Eremiobacteraeota bacterium]